MPNICGLSSAEANRAQVRYIFEDTACWGVTPASGTSREARITGSSLVPEKETTVSNELRADRMVSNIVETAASSGGDIEWEFSAGSQDDFFQAFVLGQWTRPMAFDFFAGDTVAVASASTLTITGDYSDYFTVGRHIKTSGFTNPANNAYLELSVVGFAAGVTTLTVTATSLVAETGNTFSRVSDANDVVVANDTTIRFGTGGASTIDSNGNDAFAAAVAVGQLVVGQKLYVQGLGQEAGSIQFTAAGTDGDTFTIGDGENTVTFELDSDSAFDRANVQVTIGVDADATAANLASVLMEQYSKGALKVKAVAATDTVTITNLARSSAGKGSIAAGTAPVVVTAFANGDNNVSGIFTVTNVSNDVLTVTPAPATNANAGAAPITIKGSHLRNPGAIAQITRQSFSIETGYTDVGQYFTQSGMRVGSFAMEISAGDIVTGSFSFMGKGTVIAQASALGNAASYDVVDANGCEVMNATTNVGSLYKNGAELSTGVATIEIEGEANLRNQSIVSSKFPGGIGVGRFNLNGKITSYFENLDMFNDFLEHTTMSIGWDLEDNDGNYYFFTIPALKITSDPIAPAGVDEDVMEEMDWVAQRDPALNTMFMIDRFSSLELTTA